MGRDELIASLYRDGEEKARELWAQAEAEAQKTRAEAKNTLDRKRAEDEALRSRLLAEEERPLLREAERQARAIRAQAKAELADKLYRLARESLDRPRQEEDALFATLAAELPPLAWQRISVHPSDRTAAEGAFPGAEIVGNAEICGGLRAVDKSGRIQVDNSLPTRLDRAWPEILPELLDAVLLREGLR